MRYRSKLVEIEAMLWDGDRVGPYGADTIVTWVNTNGGEARYKNHWEGDRDKGAGNRVNRIAIHTINGWAYTDPGHYVVMGSATFRVSGTNQFGYGSTQSDPIRDFYPCDPETFEKRWVSQ